MRLEELVSVYSEVEVGLSVFSEGLWDSVCVFFLGAKELWNWFIEAEGWVTRGDIFGVKFVDERYGALLYDITKWNDLSRVVGLIVILSIPFLDSSYLIISKNFQLLLDTN